MAKWHGVIGFVQSVQTTPGVWTSKVTERSYYGETQTTYKNSPSDTVIDDINIANEFSIVADQFAYDNFNAMRYVEFMGVKWKISTVKVLRPRLILTTGGEYNG